MSGAGVSGADRESHPSVDLGAPAMKLGAVSTSPDISAIEFLTAFLETKHIVDPDPQVVPEAKDAS